MSTSSRGGLTPVRTVLPNGATVIAQRTGTHPAVTALISVHAGTAYNPEDLGGVAHFVSRVLDRGTTARTADALAEELDGRGVSLNLHAGRHLFTTSFTAVTEDLDEMLALAADVVRHPTFPEAEVETRRGEIVTAIRQDEDNPASVATECLAERLYPPGHPYGRPAKGRLAAVERIGRADLVAFHRQRFSPAGMIVVLVGDVDPHEAIDVATRSFGDWTGPELLRVVPAPVAIGQHRVRVGVAMPGKSQSDVAYGFVAVTRRDPDYYPLVVMNNVLGQYGLGGRLGDSIRERQGMAYYAFSSFEGTVGEGALVVRAGVAPENVERTLASIDDEIAKLVAEGVSAAELGDAVRYLVGSLPRNLETNGGIATFLQSVEFHGLGLDFDRRVPGLLERVTLDDVQRVARRVMDPARATVVVAGPGADAAEASPAA